MFKMNKTTMVGAIDGNVMYHMRCKRFAPSSRALSYNSGLMPEIAAK